MRKFFSNAVVMAAAVGAVFILVGSAVFFYSENTYSNCVVNGTDRVNVSDGNGGSSSDARVYTENCGTFQVADSLVKGQFNSADTFGSIKEGETYTFTTIGFRNGFLSQFPNIIEVK